jgi:hypothetical protein
MTAQEFFHGLNINTMNTVAEFYAADAEFHDPSVSVKGADAIRAHYAYQYASLRSIRWVFEPDVTQGDRTVLIWKMTIEHPSLRGGAAFTVPGSSLIRFNAAGKAVYHRDYFDMGAFVYEQLPVLRSLIRFIKGRVGAGSQGQ